MLIGSNKGGGERGWGDLIFERLVISCLKGVPIPDFARHKNNLKKKDFLPKKKISVMYALHKQLDK